MNIIEHQLEFGLIKEDKLNRKTEALLSKIQWGRYQRGRYEFDSIEANFWMNVLEVTIDEYLKHQEILKQRRKELRW